jgi:DNA-binding transcriptional ArsR family regulator
MVNYNADALDAVFGSLADPTRRAILARLARGPATVSELAEPFDISLPAISRHVRVLEDSGLLARTIEGRVHHVELAAQPLKDAMSWLETHTRFWSARLDALARHVERTAKEEPSWPHPNSRSRRRSVSSARSRPRPRRSSTRGRGPRA